MSWTQYELNVFHLDQDAVKRVLDAVGKNVQLVTSKFDDAVIVFETDRNAVYALKSALSQECAGSSHATCFYLDETATECGYFVVNTESMCYGKPAENFLCSFSLFDSADKLREEFKRRNINLIANEMMLTFISEHVGI